MPINRTNYRPTWLVTRLGHEHPFDQVPGLGVELSKTFSGHRAEQRATKFAARHGLRVAPGMGNRHGWVCAEGWNAEQFIAAVDALAGRAT